MSHLTGSASLLLRTRADKGANLGIRGKEKSMGGCSAMNEGASNERGRGEGVVKEDETWET